MSITVLFEYNLVLVEAVVLVVENEVGIDVTTSHANLEMHVVSGGTAGAPLQGNNLTCSDLVACLHQVATVVTVEGGESVEMTYLHAVAIARERTRHHHGTVEDSPHAVVGETLDISAGMVSATASAIGTDDLGFPEQVAPVGIGEILQVKDELGAAAKGVINVTSRCHRHNGMPWHREVGHEGV